jgi:oxygen-independent coproporphyrinogen-3 oxidase
MPRCKRPCTACSRQSRCSRWWRSAALGFESINVDLIYGLPRQTPESFARTLAQVVQLRPDRIALYAYAHLPERFKPSGASCRRNCPTLSAKVTMLSQLAVGTFMEAGYVYVGMDHFALPGPTLWPLPSGRGAAPQLPGLQHPTGLRPHWLGRVGNWQGGCHLQPERQDAGGVLRPSGPGTVAGGAWPGAERATTWCAAVIMALMCQGNVQFESIELAYLVDSQKYFAPELEAWRPWQDKVLVT